MSVVALKRPDRKSLLRAAAVCALGLAVVLAGTPVRAADDDEPPDTKFFRSLLKGIGLQKDGDDITYRERSPLVIPPRRALPLPESSAAESNPSWPIDPEIKKSREINAAKRSAGNVGDPSVEAGRRLTPDELKVGTRRGPSPEGKAASEYDSARPLSPGSLGYKGGLFNSLWGGKTEENAKFTGEPPRASLTDPPVGYQTPSPAQPYGLGKERVNSKPVDYLQDHVTPKN